MYFFLNDIHEKLHVRENNSFLKTLSFIKILVMGHILGGAFLFKILLLLKILIYIRRKISF